MKDKICYYCGMPASTKDHVIPKAILKTFDIQFNSESLHQYIKNRTLLVPSCRECNNLLGATIQESLTARKAYLKKKLKQRYKKVLKMPKWTEEELNQMGKNLRSSIIASMNEKELIKKRIAW